MLAACHSAARYRLLRTPPALGAETKTGHGVARPRRAFVPPCAVSSRRPGGLGKIRLQPGIDRLALQRQHAEDAFMHAPQRRAVDESLQPLVAERELALRQVVLAAQPA